MPNRFRTLLVIFAGAALLSGNAASAGKWKRKQYCPQPSCPQSNAFPQLECPPNDSTESGADTPTPDAPKADTAPVVPMPAQQPFSPPAQPQNFMTASTSPQSVAPNMIGDLFNTGSGGLPDEYSSSVVPPGAGTIVGRQKIGENTSPLPRDRVFLNYSYFDNTPLAQGGIEVNRFTPGFEKTFLNGDMSFELRVPFAYTLNSTLQLDTRTSVNEAELGNLTMYLKALLYSEQEFAFSAGLGVALPTADDIQVFNGDTLVSEIQNEAVHILPFLGALYTPNDRFFAQGFLQVDFDANGNDVFDDDMIVGTINDSTLLYLDLSVGYWLVQNFGTGNFVQGIAPIFEVHYNASITNNDQVQGSEFDYGNSDEFEVVNAVFGITTAFENNSQLTFGYTVPVNGSDQQFDGELRIIFNKFFGGSQSSGYNVNRRFNQFTN